MITKLRAAALSLDEGAGVTIEATIPNVGVLRVPAVWSYQDIQKQSSKQEISALFQVLFVNTIESLQELIDERTHASL